MNCVDAIPCFPMISSFDSWLLLKFLSVLDYFKRHLKLFTPGWMVLSPFGAWLFVLLSSFLKSFDFKWVRVSFVIVQGIQLDDNGQLIKEQRSDELWCILPESLFYVHFTPFQKEGKWYNLWPDPTWPFIRLISTAKIITVQGIAANWEFI